MSMVIARAEGMDLGDGELGIFPLLAMLPMVMSAFSAKKEGQGASAGSSGSQGSDWVGPLLNVIAMRHPDGPGMTVAGNTMPNPGAGVASAQVYYCPAGMYRNPTWDSIPLEQRGQAQAQGVQPCLSMAPTGLTGKCPPEHQFAPQYNLCWNPAWYPNAAAANAATRAAEGQGYAAQGAQRVAAPRPGARGRRGARALPARGAMSTTAHVDSTMLPQGGWPAAGGRRGRSRGHGRIHGYFGGQGLGDMGYYGTDIGPVSDALGAAAPGITGFVKEHSTAFMVSGALAVLAGIGVAAARAARRRRSYGMGAYDMGGADCGCGG